MKTRNAMKRLLSLVLSLVLLIGIMPQMVMPVSALSMEIIDIDGPQDGGFTYLDNVTILIDTDSINNLILPTTITYPYTGKTWKISDFSSGNARIDLSDAFTAETFPGVDSPVEQRTFHIRMNYNGEILEKDFVFNVLPREAFNDRRHFTVSPEEWIYNGDTPYVTLVNTGTKYGDKTLVAGRDYTAECLSENNNVGWKEFRFTGIGNYSGSFEDLILIVPTTEIPDIRMETDAVHYDGTAKEPGIMITFNGKTVDTADYELSYSDNTEVGTATVTIKGKNNFSYETTRTFQIQDHVWVNECCGTDLQCKDCDATKENDRTEHEFSNSACLHCSFVCENHSYNADKECTICGAKMENYVGVNDITLDIGTTVPANREVFVTATAYPEDRTEQNVVFTYEIEEDNGAQAHVGGGNLQSTYLTAYNGGTFKLKVTANDGFTTYSKTFTITSVYTPVTAVDGTVPTEAEVGQITLPSGFLPQEVSSQYDLAWEVQSGPATVQGNVLTLTDVGTVKLRAYVINGLGVGQPFVQEYTIEAKPAQTVLPVELNINEGNIIISEHSATELKVEYGGTNESVISKDTPVQISGSSNSKYTITVKSGAPKITLRDVNIRNYSAHPLLIESGASADITLLGSNTLDASVRSVGVAGLGVPEGASVTIGGTGTLTVKGGGDAAGIGSRAERNSGTITMNGGTVNATGGDYGAGIGSGEKGTAGTITINGGNVNAQGGESAAGIGGGNGGVASAVTIKGGTVNASGGRYGPGIGSGYDRDYTDSNPAQITITGGTVTARGGDEGAGIGGGSYRPGATVTVTGGNVKATGGYNAAGIGGGRRCSGGSVAISSGIVNATGGEEGAGIGSGAYSGSNSNATGGNVTISGGTVTAAGGQYGAGIGGGRYCPGGNVVITGGNVKTSPGKYAMAIGKGYDGKEAGTLTNGTDPVTLNTITLVGMTEQSSVTAAAGIGSYGLQDVRTLDTNKLYFYLPANTAATAITAGNVDYFCKDSDGNYYTSHDWSNKDGVCAHCGEICDHEVEANTCIICGKSFHDHDWEYTADGTTITAKCLNADTCPDAEQSFTLNAPGAVYSGNPVDAEVTREGEDLTYILHYTGTNYDSPDAPTSAGDYTVTMTVGDKSVSDSFTISPKNISKVASCQFSLTQTSFVYSGKAPVLNVTGVDSSVGSYTMQEGTDYTVGTVQVNAGSHKLTVTGKGNYTGTVELDYTIAAKKVTITGMSWDVPEDAVYNGTAYTATLTGDLPEGVTVTKTGDTATNAGSYTAKAVFSLAEGYSAENYEIVNGEDLTADWSITKVPLTVTADSYESVRYGSAAPAFTANYSGFVNGETEAVLGGELVFSCEYDTANAAKRKPGDYAIVPSGLTSNNYEISYVNGNLEVISANLVIVLDDKTVTYGDAAPEYTYHYEGFAYGEDISVMDKPGTVVCDYKPGDPVGTMEIHSDNYGEDDCYLVVNQHRATLTIEKAPLTITAEDNSITYGDAPAANGVTGTGFVNGESFDNLSGELAYSCDYEQFGNVGTYKITPSGVTSGNYEITFADGTLTVNPKAIIVKADDLSKVYGEADPELTYTVSGLVNGDKLSGALTRAAGSNVGIYAITQGTLTAGSNYAIDYTGAELTVNKRDVVITAKDQTITYGETISGAEITAVGLVDGHSATVTLTPSTTNVTNGGTITASAAVISSDGTDVTGNYNVSYTSGKLVIKPDTSKIDGLTSENVTSDDEETIKAVQEMLENADSLTEEWEDIGENCEELLDRIDETEAEQKELTDAAASFREETVKSTDKENLEQLAKDIEELLDTDNLTEDEREALETVQEQVEGMIDTIEDTAEDSKAAAETIDAHDPATVTSDDKGELEQAIETIDKLLTEDHLTEDERKALEDVKADAEALIEKIEAAQKATDTENTEKVEDVTADNIKPEDKEALEDAKADLEKALEDNAGNYTEEEKKAIQDEIQRIEDAMDALENAQDVTDAITQLPETVEPDDEEAVEKILDAKEAYDELTDHEKSLVDEDVKKKLDDLSASLTAYDIIKGDGGKWTKGTSNGLSFTANGLFSKFVGVEVDGKEVDAKYYDAKAGSTIITLKQSFLKRLSNGEHTITVLYTDGETSGTFSILAESSTPATGDDSNIMLYGSMSVMSLAALVILLLASKKRKQVS